MQPEIRGTIDKTIIRMNGITRVIKRIGPGIYLVANSKTLMIRKRSVRHNLGRSSQTDH